MNGVFISHSGAGAGESNLHELNWETARLLLDCGVAPPEGLERPDAVWISHAHADHCGGLLQLVRRFPRVPVLATKTTRRLLAFALAGGAGSGGDTRRAEAVARRVKPVPLQKFRPLPGADNARIMAVGAGHVPGAAMAVVELPDDSVVLYTGDFCTHDQRVVSGAGVPRLKNGTGIDAVVSEAMFAADKEADGLVWGDEADALSEAIENAQAAVLVGVGAIGESLEAAAIAAESGGSVMVDEYLRGVFEACRSQLGERFERLDFGDRRRLRGRLAGGSTVIAAGDQFRGTTTAGRLAADLVEDPAATIVVLNRARESTPAGRLVDTSRGETIRWGGRDIQLRANVVHRRLINHAPRWQLEGLIRGVGAPQTLLVHGPTGARWALKRSLKKGGFDREVQVVERGEKYPIREGGEQERR